MLYSAHLLAINANDSLDWKCSRDSPHSKLTLASKLKPLAWTDYGGSMLLTLSDVYGSCPVVILLPIQPGTTPAQYSFLLCGLRIAVSWQDFTHIDRNSHDGSSRQRLSAPSRVKVVVET